MSGDPRKRPSSQNDERVLLASTLLQKAMAVPLADPLPFAALPALSLHAMTAGYPDAFPASNCVDECLILAHAYAELGIEAQVRAAELTVTDDKSAARAVHGIPRPYWEDGRFIGHTVVWLPRQRHLIDPAAERYQEIAAWKAGPVIAAAGPATDQDDDVEISVTVVRGYLRLAYTLGSRVASAEVLEDPTAQGRREDNRLRGLNLASEVIWLLATQRQPADTSVIPYPRAAALIDAVRGMERHGSAGQDVYFEQRSGELAAAGPIRLHHIPLAAGIPEPAAVG